MAQREFRSDDTSAWFDQFGNGSDGALTISVDTTDSPINASCSGTAAATSLSATNVSFAPGQLLLIIQTQGSGAGNWELNKISSYSAGTITLSYPLINTYGSGAQVQVMKQYSSVTVQSGKTWSAPAWDGTKGGILAFFVSGTFNNQGTLNATQKGFRAGASINGTNAGQQGESPTAAGGTTSTSNNGGGGGGGGAGINSGGGGGYGATGATGGGNGTGGTAGASYGLAGLTTLFLGSGGGSGSSNGSGSFNSGAGGVGGGIIFVVASTITNSGTISANGGSGGNASFPGGSDSSAGSGGGSAGSGGSVLLKGTNVTLGTALVNAQAAGGGTGGSQTNSGLANGASSAVGRIHTDYGNSISGTTSPTLDSRQDSSLNQQFFGGMI